MQNYDETDFDGYDYRSPVELGRVVLSEEDESIDLLVTVRVPRDLPRKFLPEYLCWHYDTYCQHEYDCCGHWYNTVYTHKGIKKVSDNVYVFHLSSSQNV